MREYKIMASSMIATYTAGRFIADSPAKAIQQAQEDYARSPLGRTMRDVGGFRFYIVDRFPHEDEDHDSQTQ